MPGGMKLIDSTIVIVLHNGDQEIERELTAQGGGAGLGLQLAAPCRADFEKLRLRAP